MPSKKKAPPPKRRLLLSASRPKSINHHRSPGSTFLPSSQASRTLIRKYHTLEKQRAAALSARDDDRAAALGAELERLGGLSSYQRASIAGQSVARGGDSSKLLMRWLAAPEKMFAAVLPEDSYGLNDDDGRGCGGAAGAASRTNVVAPGRKLRLLEVGALSPENVCAKSGLFEMERIDLRSRHQSIKEQDFMERPVPSSEAALAREGLDVVSLSLVLNFVPDAAARGAMLRRVSSFLRPWNGQSSDAGDQKGELFPSLFLVLPEPCISNSRYLDEERLGAMLESLGYRLARRKLSKKLASYLWRYEGSREAAAAKVFKKEEIRSGGGRNNFAITLR